MAEPFATKDREGLEMADEETKKLRDVVRLRRLLMADQKIDFSAFLEFHARSALSLRLSKVILDNQFSARYSESPSLVWAHLYQLLDTFLCVQKKTELDLSEQFAYIFEPYPCQTKKEWDRLTALSAESGPLSTQILCASARRFETLEDCCKKMASTADILLGRKNYGFLPFQFARKIVRRDAFFDDDSVNLSFVSCAVLVDKIVI